MENTFDQLDRIATSCVKPLNVRDNPDGSYTVVVIHGDGKTGSTVFNFSEIERLKKSEFNCFVQVKIHNAGDPHIYEYSSRINLASMSAREGFIRALQRISKGKEFDSHLSQAVEAISKKLNDIPASQSVIEIEPITGRMMLFDPFITDKSANLIFGDGASTKSYICIHLAISLVSGLPFAGFKPDHKANVLYFDFEDVGGKFTDRVYRVAGGMKDKPSMDDLKNLRYMKAYGASFADMIPKIKEEIKKYNIELMVIDSAAYACGAEIEKADAVIKYFNLLDGLGIATLAIAHVTKQATESEDKIRGQNTAIGSIFFNNAPRNTWNVVKQGDSNDQESVKKVCMFHRKCNDSKLHRRIPLEVDFSNERSTAIRLGNESDWEEANSIKDKIFMYIKSHGATNRSQLCDEFTEADKNTIKVSLRRLKTDGKIIQIGGEKGDYIVPSTVVK